MINITEKEGSVTLAVRVVPRASRSEIIGTMDGALKVRIASPPVDGAANAELIRLLSKSLGIAKGDVAIVSGSTAKLKHLRISGVTAEKVRGLIG